MTEKHHSRINKDNRYPDEVEKSDNFPDCLVGSKRHESEIRSRSGHQTRKYKCPAKSQKWETCN